MLTPKQRLDRYLAQTRRKELTFRQMRRLGHKTRRFFAIADRQERGAGTAATP